MNVGECRIMIERMGIEPCEECSLVKTPSYFENGVGRGCLIAHTALCLYELNRIKWRVHRVVGEALKNMCPPVDPWGYMEALIVLHDIGKLSYSYGAPGFKHNVCSAEVAYRFFEEDAETALQSSLLAYIHHEAFEWINVRKEFKVSLFQGKISSPINMDKSRLEKFINRMSEIYWQAYGEPSSGITMLGNKVGGVRLEAVKPGLGSIYRRKLTPKKLINTLKLYYILHLVDNRAASARRGGYWDLSAEIRWINLSLLPLKQL